MTIEIYTDAQAIDEAVLLLTRKLRRLHWDIYADLMGCLPYGARDALNLADVRADKLRASDQREGITRVYIDPWTDDETKLKPSRSALTWYRLGRHELHPGTEAPPTPSEEM